MQESHSSPNIGETAEALERRCEALSGKDCYAVLYRLAYGTREQQQALVLALNDHEAWKRGRPGNGGAS